jgi:two-component system heavy metal sensor histidine kinase CusS
VRFETVIAGDQAVPFDRKWMRQVLLNLVGNAVRASPPGGLVTLRSEFTIGHWRVEVEDEGPGVPEGERERIFERFVRLQAANSTAASGTGLGLAICRSMVEMQGGVIRAAEGARAGGLCMVCELPLAAEPVQRVVAAKPAPGHILPD